MIKRIKSFQMEGFGSFFYATTTISCGTGKNSNKARKILDFQGFMG
jgi:hypothetical protein